MECEDIAVLPVKSYDHWCEQQIKSRVRNQIRKAEKEGVTVRETGYDDDFVRGMAAIFNEAPVRQGRRFLALRQGLRNRQEPVFQVSPSRAHDCALTIKGR